MVPSPTRILTATPPPASVTIDAINGRPSTVPRSPFVVKWNSRMRPRTRSGMPGPVSETVSPPDVTFPVCLWFALGCSDEGRGATIVDLSAVRGAGLGFLRGRSATDVESGKEAFATGAKL